MTATIKLALWAVIAVLGAVTGCDRSTKPQFEVPATDKDDTISIATLKSRCTSDCVAVNEDLLIEGYVTGNDLYGEFYKQLVVEDASGGIGIAIDVERLHARYPIGTKLEIHCNGLYLYNYGGKIELCGAPDEDFSGAGRVPADELSRYVRAADAQPDPLKPHVCKFDEIDFQAVDTFIHFEQVRFVNSDGNWCEVDSLTGHPIATERTIVDLSGQKFVVRTAGSCSYALESLPQGVGSLSGVVDYFNHKFTLRVVNHAIDFQMID